MTNQEVKVVITEVVGKLKLSVGRETNYFKELDDDSLLLKTIGEMQLNGEPLPDNCAYGTYEEWIEQINKEVKSSEGSISRIGREKAEIIAFEYFLVNAETV